MDLPVLKPEEHVLSTLEHDGSRRWIYPKLAKGPFWSARRIVAYVLIAIYALLPYVKINGAPAILLDITHRKFHLFGFTFLPTDTVLLAIFVVALFLTIFFVTAIAGRVWCGWACPQTVYMEFLFRPLERLFTGTSGKGAKPKKKVAPWRYVAMYVVYLVICLHLAHMFLAYFVGVDKVHEWIWSSTPVKHPVPFAVVAVLTGLMMFDFCFWREQLCIIGCPYGRFQSVMLDPSSLIVGYDEQRGEPRGKGRDREAKGLGSCVDCGLCFDVCPTGIDIRNGLQLECIGCAQCVDVCDEVMERTGQPKGLIRYSSQRALAGEPTRIVRPRTIVYLVAISLLATAFVTVLTHKSAFDVTVLRALGRPFVVTDSGDVENILRVRIVNRDEVPQTYRIEVVEPANAEIASGANVDAVEPEATVEQPVYVQVPRDAFKAGRANLVLHIFDGQDRMVEEHFYLLGP